MLIRFDEEFDLPVADVYSFFRTPRDWPRLFGAFGTVEDQGDGWHAVPLRRFPFPLVARVTTDEPEARVGWVFRGFWKGEGEVRFVARGHGVAVRGFERLAVRPLGPLSPAFERLFLERRFQRVWDSGWRRLRRQEKAEREL